MRGSREQGRGGEGEIDGRSWWSFDAPDLSPRVWISIALEPLANSHMKSSHKKERIGQ